MPATTTVAGQSWQQQGATATSSGTSLKLIALGTNHPASSSSTKLFVIVYGAPAQTFDQENGSAFQPMLQSFKFTG